MASMQQYPRYYIEHGIKAIGQLITLRKNELAEFMLPMNSALHYAVRDTTTLGLPEDDELFVNLGRRILVDYKYEYPAVPESVGSPIRRQRIILKEIRKFQSENKRFKWIGHSSAWLPVPTVPYIINYNSLDKTYKYRPRDGVVYWKQINFLNTVVAGINSVLKDTLRYNFFFMDVPNVLPTVSRLQDAERDLKDAKPDDKLPLSRRIRNIIDTDGKMLLLQLWLWAGENRHLSVFSQIKESDLDRVIFLTALDGRYSIVNLGLLNKWIRNLKPMVAPDGTVVKAANPKGAIAPKRAQRLILRHFMALQQLATVSDDTVIVDVDSITEKAEVSKALNIEATEDDRITEVEDDSEFISQAPATPTLDVNVDASKLRGSVNFKAKTTKIDLEPIEGEQDDVEDFLFHQMDLDLAQHNATGAQIEADNLLDSESVYKAYEAKTLEPDTRFNEKADELAASGLLSSAEIRRLKSLGSRYKKITSPFDEKQTLEEYNVIDPKDLEVDLHSRLTKKKVVGVVDDSMLNYSLKGFTKKYVDDVLGKDVTNSIVHFQNAGIAVTDMKMERVDEFLGSYNLLSVQFTPLTGKPSTVKFKFPVLEKDGTFYANGVRYFMKTQRNEMPIRKVNFDNVALTSNISKIFVQRTPRVRFNHGDWIVNQINRLSLDNSSGVTDVSFGDGFDQLAKLPLTYSSISRKITQFKFHDIVFSFNYKEIESRFGKELVERSGNTIPVATQIVDGRTKVYRFTEDNQFESYILGIRSPAEKLGSFESFLGLDRESAPVNFAEAKINGFPIPVGILMGYQIGFGNLLKTAGCKYRRMKRSGFDISPNEFALIFEDEVLAFSRDDQKACLIFNGFNQLKNQIRRLSIYTLDNKDVYSGLLTALRIPISQLKQYPYLFDVWVDHITKGILEEMNEPTDLLLLMISAIDKLCDDQFEDPNNIAGSLLKGHERIASMIYASLHGAARQYVNAPASKQTQISINPNEVWFSIVQDESVAVTEESNPIHSLKEKENVVFGGKGGRSSDTMTAKHRQFTKDNIGIISEANVDNGKTGTVLYLTSDPNIKSLRGVVKPVADLKTIPKSKVQSTAMLVSAGSDTDDAKRVTFTNVMMTSTTFLHNAVPNRVLTGAERTIQYRVDDQWCRNATKPGKVVGLDSETMTVEYTDGKKESFKIGRHFGVWSGMNIPHEIKAGLNIGDVFDVDDVLSYNSHYFQKDTMNPKSVIFKRGIRGNMLLWEATDTLEDADTISADFSKRLDTSMSEKRPVIIPSDHEVEILKDVGDTVDSEDILCTLKPPMSEFGSSYNSAGLDALDTLNTLTPKAEHRGVIESIEVLYTGEYEKMSQSLQDIVAESDAKLYRLNKKLGIPVTSRKVPPSYAIDGKDLGKDTVVLMYRITERVGAGIGDKLVIFNQLKTIISNIVDKPYVTEHGQVIDITFSRQSISNRIVNSPDLIGTTNTALSLIEKEMIEAYTGANFKKPQIG